MFYFPFMHVNASQRKIYVPSASGAWIYEKRFLGLDLLINKNGRVGWGGEEWGVGGWRNRALGTAVTFYPAVWEPEYYSNTQPTYFAHF